MKRFRFSLAALLRVKEQREQLAAARVGQARREVDRCREEVSRLHLALGYLAGQLGKAPGQTLAPDSWVGTFDQANRLDEAILRAEQNLAQAERVLQEAIQARTHLAMEVEMLDTLRQQHWQIHRQEMMLIEQERIDEVGLRLWRQQQKQPGFSVSASADGQTTNAIAEVKGEANSKRSSTSLQDG